MGHHYIPQKYLQGFAVSRENRCVWQFDKKSGAYSDTPASIKKVAQEKSYYDPNDETKLNENVERPANRVFDKLRSGYRLDPEDRKPLAKYMATMLYRVPKKRQYGHEIYPNIVTKLFSHYKAEWTKELRDPKIDLDSLQSFLLKLDSLEANFNQKMPEEVIQKLRSPWPTEALVQCLLNMNWFLQGSNGPSFFVTSDNPMFTFNFYGVAHSKAEFTFPIAPNLALFGTWKKVQSNRQVDTSQSIVKEANRRIVSTAYRFVYSHIRADWLPVVASKPNPHLCRIGY